MILSSCKGTSARTAERKIIAKICDFTVNIAHQNWEPKNPYLKTGSILQQTRTSLERITIFILRTTRFFFNRIHWHLHLIRKRSSNSECLSPCFCPINYNISERSESNTYYCINSLWQEGIESVVIGEGCFNDLVQGYWTTDTPIDDW